MANDLWDDFRGKPEHTQLQSQQAPWAPQQNYLNGLFSSASDLYSGRGSYQGPHLGDASPWTSYAHQNIVNQATNPRSLTAQGSRVIGDTISGKYLDPKTNPYLEGSVNDALGLAKSQFLGLYGGDAGQNVGNSGFQEQLARTLASSALPAYQNAYSQERQNQLNALNLAPSFDYAPAMAMAGVGREQEARSQAEVDAQRAAWMSPWDNLARFQSAITGNYGREGMQQVPWTSQIYDNYQSERDANFKLAGSAFSMFSDVRLKENIERIGTHDKGIGIYKYTYVGDDTPQIGVLAQEVEQVMPEAVGESQGFLTVNYKMI